MLSKRIIGVVTVRDGRAVQSFGYRRYLPLGRPEVIVENLDRWGADEILVACIDRTLRALGPDFDLIERLGALGLSTPLIYSGGIRHRDDAVRAVRMGCDRIVVDSLLRDSPDEIEPVSRALGTQALIAHMAVCRQGETLLWRDHRNETDIALDGRLAASLPLDWASEVMLSDWRNEGRAESFDETIPPHFPLADKPLIVFGGLSEPSQIQRVLSARNIVAAAVGNFLSYKEHAVQTINKALSAFQCALPNSPRNPSSDRIWGLSDTCLAMRSAGAACTPPNILWA